VEKKREQGPPLIKSKGEATAGEGRSNYKEKFKFCLNWGEVKGGEAIMPPRHKKEKKAVIWLGRVLGELKGSGCFHEILKKKENLRDRDHRKRELWAKAIPIKHEVTYEKK